MALDPNEYQNTKLNYHDKRFAPSNFPTNSGRNSHRWFSPQENMENKGFHGEDLGISDASFASIGRADLSDRRVLTERNRNNFGSGERKSHNSGIHFDFFSYGDRPKHNRVQSEADLTGFKCQCDSGSIYKSNSNSNRSIERTFQDVGGDFKPSTIASEENFDRKSILETGSRPLCRVASEGNLNELQYKYGFGSTLERRSVSPKVRTSLNPEMVSDLSATKRCSCVCELSVDSKEAQTHLPPNNGFYFSPNKNPSSNRSKPSYTRRMDYLSLRCQCLCYKPKSQKRDTSSSPSLQEKFIQQSSSDEPERKVNFGSAKSNSGFSRICKYAIFCVLLVMVFLSAPIKEISFPIPKFGAWNSSLGINHTDLFPDPVDMGSNYSEDVNSERQIEPSIEKEGSCRGEMEKEIKSLALNDTAPTKEVQTLEEPDFTELHKEEEDGHEELKSESRDEFKIENTKQCEMLDFNVDGLESPVPVPGRIIGHVALVQADINDTIEDRKVQTHEEPDFTELPLEEKDGHEELQSESKDEFKIENAKQCEVLGFTADGIEGPLPVPGRKIGYVELVQADANNKVEDRKVEMRIRFCMAFVSVAACASMVSCIVKREQFGEMLHRYSSPKIDRKNLKKEQTRENSVVLEGSYGSIVTYEKIPAKKRGGHKDGLLTPVRRSSRIRNYLASPS